MLMQLYRLRLGRDRKLRGQWIPILAGNRIKSVQSLQPTAMSLLVGILPRLQVNRVTMSQPGISKRINGSRWAAVSMAMFIRLPCLGIILSWVDRSIMRDRFPDGILRCVTTLGSCIYNQYFFAFELGEIDHAAVQRFHFKVIN